MFGNMSSRNIAWLVVFMLGLSLYSQWGMEQHEKSVAQLESNTLASSSSDLDSIPDVSKDANNHNRKAMAVVTDTDDDAFVADENAISISTDVLNLKVSETGDIISAELKAYPQEIGGDTGVMLLSQDPENYFVAQRGLLSEGGPDSKLGGRSKYTSEKKSYSMGDEDALVVEMTYVSPDNVTISKIFRFERGEYNFDVDFKIKNNGTSTYSAVPFGRLKLSERNSKSVGGMGIKVFSGGVIKTPVSADSYQKVSFDDFGDGKYNYKMDGGWVAFAQQYFIGAWIPASQHEHQLSTEVLKAKIAGKPLYALRFIDEAISVSPGDSLELSSKFYAGPEIADDLKALSPGLQKTLDYGIFWPLAWPIFLVLKYIHSIIGNWGLAIIGTTVLIKLLFYRLSASSYRSMAKMKKLQPRMEELKERYGDDRQGLGQAMMKLYKDEKVNPLGGCLPILIQIPVFIALYWVLIESVELRQAPFYLWIKDLSVKDPFYVLPILMGASMLLQQRLSPTPPDPVQAKVMMIMPIIFTFLFLQFPSGLVLYWVANNLLSISQQLYITKTIERENDQPRKNRTKARAKQK